MTSNIKDIVIFIILAIMIVSACIYIYKEKKNGRKCIGCSYACNCSKRNIK